MILKGLYNTKIDRMKTDQYKSYMFNKLGVMIDEDLSSYKSKGFIMKDIWYRLYIPYIEDGDIFSFKRENMEYFGCFYGIIELKAKVKEIIREQPERFIELANIIRKDNEQWQSTSQQLHTGQPIP